MKPQIIQLISRILKSKIIIDSSCVITVGLVVLIINLYAEPYHRGFFCNDESISHPYHESTVPDIAIYIGGVIPLFVILIGEYSFIKSLDRQSSTMPIACDNFSWISIAYKKMMIYLFGAFVILLTCDTAKYTIGRLRPHFLDLCKPNVNCSLPENHHVYIENFTCTPVGVRKKLMTDARLSFPSSHSSVSTYVMLFLVLYIQTRMTQRGSKLLKHFLQLICLMLAWFTAMSRISNYKHHWSDVLCGILIGVITCLITVFCIENVFKEKHRHHNHSYTVNVNSLSAPNNVRTEMQVNSITADPVC